MNLIPNLKDLSKIIYKNQNDYHPQFFNLGLKTQQESLQNLINQNAGIKVFDALDSQLYDLIKLRNPKRNLTKEQNAELVKDHLGDVPIEQYGNWVYYPWSNRLVHLLGKEEYTEVRTNRNIYKISPDEIIELGKKRIGLIGLSVGQSVALTLALERGFGELRITDFDELELTNLNRIRTGVHNLGINKSVSVAREIAEIDPYLEVKCYSEGLTEENIDSFFLDGGKLDLLIDECDGLDIKIICRQVAKKYSIPVLMEASDRGMLDVERYDLEPDRPLLHGMINHLDASSIKNLKTNEEKVPFMLPFVGIDTISNRAKASMLEIGESITTWPQLASAVTLGGGITADVARRILLNQFHDSGRYYVDVEEIIGPKKISDSIKSQPMPFHSKVESTLTLEEMEEIMDLIPDTQTSEPSIILSESNLNKLIEDAIMAPSAGNNQPWFWFYHSKGLFLFHNLERSFSYLDVNHGIAYTGLGAAIENLDLSARNLGLSLNTEYFPIEARKDLIARFQFTVQREIEPSDNLYNFIDKRCTNRKIAPPQKIEVEIVDKLISAAERISGAKVKFVDSKNDLEKIGKIIAFTERLRLMDKAGHDEFFFKELKWNPEQAEKDRTGIDLRTTDLSPSDVAGLKISRNWEVIDLLKSWKVGKGLEKLSKKSVAGASALGLITIPTHNSTDFIMGGRAVQRLWLEATRNQVSMQPLLAPISFFQKNHLGEFDTETSYLLSEYETELREVFQISPHESLVFLFRILDADEPVMRSLRMNRNQLFYNSLNKRGTKISEDVA